MIQRLTLYATLGLLLDALGHDYTTAGFWCLLGLFWCGDVLARQEGFDQATDLAQDTWQAAKKLLEEARALRAAKGYTDED